MDRDSPIVYICSKYSGDVVKNTIMARRYSRLAVERGFIPIAPHLLLPQFLSEETERDLAMEMDLGILRHCGELWVCGVISKGMQKEIDEAERIGMPVRRISEEELNVRDQ
jgi:hypothetical protein